MAPHIPGARNLQILLFGLTLSSSWGNGHATPYRALVKALHELKVEVVFYERDVPYYARHRDFGTCDDCELILYKNWEAIRQNTLRRAQSSDVVLTASYLPEGALISEQLLGVDGPLHVFYDMDTPITLSKMQDGGVDYLRPKLIPQFDLYLSFTGGAILRTLEQSFGARCVLPLYGCVDPDLYVRVGRQTRFACDLSFMGTYASDRADRICELLLAPAMTLPQQSFLLAGPLYPTEWAYPANLKRVDHVAPSHHPALYSSSRATLNVTRKEMARSGYCPSGRFFEASACGTPLLTDEWDGLESFFDVEQELLVVRSTDDVVRALKLPDADLERISSRARERTLDEHTGQQRAKQLLAACEKARQANTATAEIFS